MARQQFEAWDQRRLARRRDLHRHRPPPERHPSDLPLRDRSRMLSGFGTGREGHEEGSIDEFAPNVLGRVDLAAAQVGCHDLSNVNTLCYIERARAEC